MKLFAYSFAAGLTAAMLMAAPASAAPARSLDAYGCRWEGNGQYHCYKGSMAGRGFENQRQMIHTQMRAERLVPVYVDDDGAPRPMPPHASRGRTLPPIDANETTVPFSWPWSW